MDFIIIVWLLGSLVVWHLLLRFTRLRGGTALGVTIMLGSLPAWIFMFSLFDPFSNGNVGLIGAVLMLFMIGGGLLALGFAILLASLLSGGINKLRSRGADAGNRTVEPENHCKKELSPEPYCGPIFALHAAGWKKAAFAAGCYLETAPSPGY